MSLAGSLFGLREGEETGRARDIADDQAQAEPANLVRLTLAQACAMTGDVLANPKVTLPWLMGVVGAPAFLTSMIVPIRESFALLPQIFVAAWIRRYAVRKGFWIVASLIEGLAVLAMAAVAVVGFERTLAGWCVIAAVSVFSLARGVASIAWKDTLGKTVDKGRRGKVGGYAASVSGVMGFGAGLYLALAPAAARPDWLLYVMLAAAAASWVSGAAVLLRLKEHTGPSDADYGLAEGAREQLKLLQEDKELRRFLLARGLMISTALATPFYVALAHRSGGDLRDLGWLLLANGAAGALSAAFWGRLSDRSSRSVMALGAAICAAATLAVLAALALAPSSMAGPAPYAAALFVAGVGHAGVRIGRKTQIIDIADGDEKSAYVAVSNTIIGVALLAIGAAVGGVAAVSLEAALLLLAAMALGGAALALTLRNAQAA